METNGVTFYEEESSNLVSNIRIVKGKPKGMLAWMVEKKVAKSGKQAEQFLLAVAALALVAAVGIAVFSFLSAPRQSYTGPLLGPAKATPLHP